MAGRDAKSGLSSLVSLPPEQRAKRDHSGLRSRGKIEMLLYVLIGLSLALAGVSGLQLTYMMYLDRLDRERRKRVRELEVKCRSLTRRLEEAETKIADQRKLLDDAYAELDDEEAWADVIEDR